MKKLILFIIGLFLSTNVYAVQVPDFDAVDTPASGDILYIIDASDTTDRAEGTGKRTTVGEVLIDANIPNSITIDTATTATSVSFVNSSTPTSGNVLVADGTDFESVAISGDGTITSAGVLTVTNASTADALTSNGSNCSAGSAPLGVDASGASESCFDVWTEAENTSAAYLQNIVEDTTPQLGGELDAQSNSIVNLSDVTFRTGAQGGTLRTGTSAADKFNLEAYDVDGGVYVDMFRVDAGNTVTAEFPYLTDNGFIKTSGGVGLLSVDTSTYLAVNTSTATAGRLMIADGTDFESQALQGDCTVNGAGFINCTSSGGAPTDATYITQTANGTLSAEQALSSLSSGIMRVATTTGVITSLTDSSGIAANISDETGSGALVFATSPTLVTPVLGTITSGVGTALTALNGENIQDDTIDDDSIDFGTGTDQVSLIDFPDVNTATVTAGRLLIADGTDFESMLLQGDCTMNGAGYVNCTGGSGATQLSELSDVNTSTATAGRLLIADGTDFESQALQGDCTINGAGFINCASGSGDVSAASSFGTDNVVIRSDGTGKGVQSSGLVIDDSDNLSGVASLTVDASATPTIGFYDSNATDGDENANIQVNCTDTGSGTEDCDVTFNQQISGASTSYMTVDADGIITLGKKFAITSGVTAANLLIADGTDFESVAMSGDCTITAGGVMSCASSATQLTDLSDVNTAGATAGNFLVADGTDFESVAMSGDATISSAGAVTVADDSHAHTTTTISGLDLADDITNVGSDTPTAGNILVADGTDFESVAVSGDATISSAGAVTVIAATTTNDGISELATEAETTTGTDATRTVTPDGLSGSNYGKRVVGVLVFDDATAASTGDGAGDVFFRIPSVMNGWNLVDIECSVQTAGTTGTTDVQIHNVTQAADMLTTKCTIDSAETDSATAATAPVIDTANDDVATADRIRIDVDAVSTTPPQGLYLEMTFQNP